MRSGPDPAAEPALLPALAGARAGELAARFSDTHIIVVGDVMLDRFLVGRVDRISPEAPVPVVAFEREEHRPGGAANVAVNARVLGARVTLIGLIGEDAAAAELGDDMAVRGVGTSGLVTAPGRPTTVKTRVVTTRNQQVARIDYEADGDIDAALEDALLAQLDGRATGAHAVIVSDYMKGAVTARVMAGVVERGRALGVPVLVDPKIPHLDYYTGASLVTPNHHEAEAAGHTRIRSHADARRVADELRARWQAPGVLITRGEHGMWLSHETSAGYLPASAREVSDVTGAGDTVIATVGVALAAGASVAEAARLANEAAGIAVGRFGPAAVTPTELLARFRGQTP